MEIFDDEQLIQRLFRAEQDLQTREPILRLMSDILSVQLSRLDGLKAEECQELWRAAALIHRLRAKSRFRMPERRMEEDDDLDRLFRSRPDLQAREPVFCAVSRTLGVPLWPLLFLDPEEFRAAWRAAALLLRLRAEDVRDNLNFLQDGLEKYGPVYTWSRPA